MSTATENEQLQLKNPGVAALLAWLWPGAGHLYQGRTAKGLLLMICILGTFAYGFYIGQGRVVYVTDPESPNLGGGLSGKASRALNRFPYLSQVMVGLPGLPALVKHRLGGDDSKDLFDRANWYVSPRDTAELNALHKQLHRYFELGRVFTMIAGLLNVLAIFDAFKGPAYVLTESKEKPEEKPAPAAAAV